MNTYGVIMAGGGGTRFWPLSRMKNPKQLLNLSGEDTLINETLNRIQCVIDNKLCFIVTNVEQGDLLKSVIQDKCPHENILLEPAARNTAACIGLSAIHIMKHYGDGIMCVFPSDHYINNIDGFKNVLEKGINIAKNTDSLITIGIKPTFPSSGYGYINFDINNPLNNGSYDVIEFVEKPDYNLAKKYIKSGKYLWNSGMFLWKVSTIISNFKRYIPKVWAKLEIIQNSLETEKEFEILKQIYPTIPKISIDYGILERSNEVLVIPGDFGWNDVGSWDSLGAIFPTDDYGNIIRGDHLSIETKNSIIYGDKRFIASIGMDNTIIVETDDAVLVCNKEKAQDVKKVVEFLKTHNKKELI